MSCVMIHVEKAERRNTGIGDILTEKLVIFETTLSEERNEFKGTYDGAAVAIQVVEKTPEYEQQCQVRR